MSLEHWENYYRSGAITSGPGGADGGYDLEIRERWSAFFAELPAKARILDIGTGNGAVALIALDTARSLGRPYEIHGTDLANIDPIRDVPGGPQRFAGIEFHPQVATESLPFACASFDAVCGQYALEYAPVAPALAEIHRVLKPGGRGQFILHHADSLIASQARESLAQAQLVLCDTRVYYRLRRCVQSLRDSPSVVERRRRELAEAIGSLQVALADSTNPLVLRVTLDAVEKLLAAGARMSPAALELEITRVERDLRASVRRLQDLLRVVRDEQAMLQLDALADASGLRVEQRARQMHDREHLIGWLWKLSRP